MPLVDRTMDGGPLFKKLIEKSARMEAEQVVRQVSAYAKPVDRKVAAEVFYNNLVGQLQERLRSEFGAEI